ncbi:hypothetical protein ACIPUB_08910 [Paeniglutamicibacter sp. ORCA_105]|uniref:hypothetical protein n=1 Tax=Paeniglutamicibacter sp. ORCA_105 TaxID=3377336 RepID=UPI003894BFED
MGRGDGAVELVDAVADLLVEVGPEELRVGVEVEDLVGVGFAVADLVGVGFGVADLVGVGFGVADLVGVGFGVADLVGFGLEVRLRVDFGVGVGVGLGDLVARGLREAPFLSSSSRRESRPLPAAALSASQNVVLMVLASNHR